MPKRCHNCKSEDHLIEDCPTLPEEKRRPKGVASDPSSSEVADDEGDGIDKDGSRKAQSKSVKVKKQQSSSRRTIHNGKKSVNKNGN